MNRIIQYYAIFSEQTTIFHYYSAIVVFLNPASAFSDI